MSKWIICLSVNIGILNGNMGTSGLWNLTEKVNTRIFEKSHVC